jgi:hypothetical protein
MSLCALGPDELRALFDDLKGRARGNSCLADAAQRLAEGLYERAPEAIVLARVFAIVPFSELPPLRRDFVQHLMEARQIAASRISGATSVLCLLGTRGEEADWNRPESSRGHLAIPLLGPEFVASIPMVARLLKELGVAVQGVEEGATLLASRTLGSLNSIFYVEDAGHARDDLGRNIIADQGFVRTYGVRSVFASGGAFMLEKSFAVVLVFTREQVPREVAERFAPLASILKTGTMSLVESGRYFPA